MDRLPFELLDRIFKRACTDDGRTGCALSAVSHYIRDASAPIRYHSIALEGARQIRTFIQLLDDPRPKPTETKPRTKMLSWMGKISRTKHKPVSRAVLSTPIFHVRHLYLSDIVGAASPPAAEWVVETPQEKKTRLKAPGPKSELRKFYGERWWDMIKTAMTLAWSTIADLLTRLAPTLEHLCNHQWISGPALFTIHFPVLVELTCFFRDNRGNYPVQDTPTPDLRVKMPTLKRLHYVAKSYGSTGLWLHTETLPPSLFLVRFSSFDTSGRLLHFLAFYSTSVWAGENKTDIIVSRHVDSSVLNDLEEVQGSIDFQSSWYDGRTDLNAIIAKVCMIKDPKLYDKRRLYQEWLLRVQGQEEIWEDKGVPLSLMIERG